jgi:hypothetical protein
MPISEEVDPPQLSFVQEIFGKSAVIISWDYPLCLVTSAPLPFLAALMRPLKAGLFDWPISMISVRPSALQLRCPSPKSLPKAGWSCEPGTS